MSTDPTSVDTGAEVAGTEADKINTGALGTLVAVGLFAMLSITAAVTALVRHDIEIEEASKDADANQVVTELKASQHAALNGPAELRRPRQGRRVLAHRSWPRAWSWPSFRAIRTARRRPLRRKPDGRCRAVRMRAARQLAERRSKGATEPTAAGERKRRPSKPEPGREDPEASGRQLEQTDAPVPTPDAHGRDARRTGSRPHEQVTR